MFLINFTWLQNIGTYAYQNVSNYKFYIDTHIKECRLHHKEIIINNKIIIITIKSI